MIYIFNFTLILLLCLREIKSDFVTLLNANRCYIDKTSDLDVGKLNLFFYDYENQVYINGSAGTAAEDISRHISSDTTRRFVIYVPGYPSDMDQAGYRLSRDTFQQLPGTYFMIIDYSSYTKPLPFIDVNLYYNAVLYAHAIGNGAGKLMAKIKGSSSYPTENLYAYGHSFGAQLLGYIGEKYHEETNERIPKMTGIDPAAPCFTTSSISDQLRTGVADHVEVYHCSEIGSRRNLSDVEYYLDPGTTLKKCKNVISSTQESCLHENCLESWLATALNPGCLVACPPEEFGDGCTDSSTAVTAGYYSSSDTIGVYYASTVNATSIVIENSDYSYYHYKFMFSV